MKKILFSSSVAVFLLISCSTPTSTAPAATAPSQNDVNIANNLKYDVLH